MGWKLPLTDLPSLAKVAEDCSAVWIYEYVGGLDVSMDDASRMQEIHRTEQLVYDLFDVLLLKCNVELHELQ